MKSMLSCANNVLITNLKLSRKLYVSLKLQNYNIKERCLQKFTFFEYRARFRCCLSCARNVKYYIRRYVCNDSIFVLSEECFARKNMESTYVAEDATKDSSGRLPEDSSYPWRPSCQLWLREWNIKVRSAIISFPLLSSDFNQRSKNHCVLLIVRIIVAKERSARLIHGKVEMLMNANRLWDANTLNQL